MLVDRVARRTLVDRVARRMPVNVPVLAVPERRGGPVVVVAAAAVAVEVVAVEVVVTADGLPLASAMS